MSKAKAMRIAEQRGFVIEDDGSLLMVRSITPRHDGSGCHELCTDPERFDTKAEAWQAVIEDMHDSWTECDIAACEWCESEWDD